MAEVAALGLVASIIQLADFVARLLKRLDEFKSELNDVSDSFRAIRVRLPVVLNSVRNLQTQLQYRTLSDDVAKALNALLEACLQDLEYLQVLLVNSLPQPAASTWERRFLALKSLGKDKAIEKRLKQLDGNLQAVIFHEISTFQNHQAKALIPGSLPVSQIGNELLKDKSHTATSSQELLHTPEATQLSVWQGNLLSKPGLFRDIAQSIKFPEDDDYQIVHCQSRPMAKLCWKICSCPQFKTPITTWSSLRRFELISQVNLQHRSSCPFFRPDASTWELGFRVSQISRQFQKVVDVAFTLKFGAGGFSISPSLVLRGFVRKDSPAFKALDNVPWLRKRQSPEHLRQETSQSELSQLLRHIQTLYQNGEASPNDVTEDGKTIATEIYLRKWQYSEFLPVDIEVYLFESLINMGVPINQADNTGSTILDSALFDFVISLELERAYAWKFLDTLMDYGAEMLKHNEIGNRRFHSDTRGFYPLWACHLVTLMETLERIPDFAEAHHCNALSLAILLRSEPNVKRLLNRSHKDLSKPNVFGQFPLHLAVKWPWAIRTLLEAGAKVNVEDENGCRPLSYACALGSLESVQMLLDAGSTLSDPHDSRGVCNRVPPLHHASVRGDNEIFKAVLRSLVGRRQDLLRKSLQHLPARTVLSIVKDLDHVLEGNEVEKLVKELQAHGHAVDIRAYAGDHLSVYYTSNLDAERAELLFLAGFTDVHGYAGNRIMAEAICTNNTAPGYQREGFIHSQVLVTCDEGGSPLAAAAYTRRYQPSFIMWLVAKGANLKYLMSYKPCGRSKITRISTVHFVAYNIGGWHSTCFGAGLPQHRDILLKLQQIDTLRIITSDLLRCTDECLCLCSKQGCTPALTFLKLYLLGRVNFPNWVEVCSSMVQEIISRIKPEEKDMRRLGEEALRLILFQRLELTHTCCENGNGDLRHPIDLTDAEEIRVEEREIIFEFEKLAKSAEEEWVLTIENFYVFAKRFLRTNFDIIAQRQLANKDYQSRLRAIGVQISE